MRGATLALVVSLGLWGCSDELTGPAPGGDAFVGSSSMPEVSSRETSLTYEVGPAGAVLELPGLRMTIPEGALPGPVAITISRREAPQTYVAYSGVWALEPAGLRFARPVAVEMDYRSGILPAQAFWTVEGQPNSFEAVAMEHDGRSARFEVEHFSSGFVGSEDPCLGDVVFGSETFVQEGSEPMQDTRDIEVDDFGVFCVLEKSDQAEPELTLEGQQLVQVCDPTTPTICEPGTPRLDPPGYVVSGLAAALPGANELGVLLNALPGSEVAVEVRYRRLNPDAVVLSRARMLKVSPILALTSTISPWRQDGVLDAVQLTAELDVLRSPADRNPRFRYFVRSSWRARALSSGEEVWRSQEVVEEYFPDCTLKCINVRSIRTVWDGTDFNDKLLNPGSYELSAEVEFERLDPRTGLRIKLDEVLPEPALIDISAPWPRISYWNANDDEQSGTIIAAHQDIGSLEPGAYVVHASVNTHHTIFTELTRTLRGAGFQLPPCFDVMGLGVRPGPSGQPILAYEIDVRPDSSCEEPPPPVIDPSGDPSPFEDAPVVECMETDDSLMTCLPTVGWDPNSDPREVYPAPWRAHELGVRDNLFGLYVDTCEQQHGVTVCPFQLAPMDQDLDPSPVQPETIVIDCSLFPSVCLLDFEALDPTGTSLLINDDEKCNEPKDAEEDEACTETTPLDSDGDGEPDGTTQTKCKKDAVEVGGDEKNACISIGRSSFWSTS